MPRTFRRGFTDKCFIFYTRIWIAILAIGVVTTVAAPFLNISDLTVINTLVEKTTEAMMVFIGFIVWKAKSENIKKHNKDEYKQFIQEEREWT